MLILGIESSCDETAAAVVEDGIRVKSSIVSSQIDIHAVFGGVVPEVAARAHLGSIYPIVQEALREADVGLDDIGAVAVTQGPGLVGSLLVGVSFAKGLAAAAGKPLIPVEHVHAHLHGALLGLKEPIDSDVFPCLALVISGGHTNLYYMPDPITFRLIATTIDDACGECFDKVAKILGQAYPGGPKIELLAKQGDSGKYPMPHMVQEKARLDFSYSGLKTHMLNLQRREGSFNESELADVAASFQAEALGQLVRKLKTATVLYSDAKSLVVAGGVAANQTFRKMVVDQLPLPAYFPDLKYCSDNAAMISAFAWHLYRSESDKGVFQAPFNWDVYSRYDFPKYLVES